MTATPPTSAPAAAGAAPAPDGAATPLLAVEDLRTWFHTGEGVYKAVDGVSFSMREGSTLGVVGESGSGKSVT